MLMAARRARRSISVVVSEAFSPPSIFKEVADMDVNALELDLAIKQQCHEIELALLSPEELEARISELRNARRNARRDDRPGERS